MTPEPARYAFVMATPLPGTVRLGVVLEAGVIASIDFLPATAPLRPARDMTAAQIELLLTDYFQKAKPLDLEVHATGTDFQQRVWRTMLEIPVGERFSYGELAKRLSSSPRAVAGACRANPIPLVIPCHRVVGKKGLGGYMGALEGVPLAIKEWLLRHESAE